ncbi:hypothetical protein HYALB_00009214 [Hymenoscyphus albidus]|uniref:FAD-binding PCMH-type domain-containing protein n=1 Tax=Hymenoscyphus albidus TaxID=595503 RepID=A0A9N9PXB6_9HELO|nr:hypothetical protein HYALB_00009214 [Hymenoscyphus albidus]
MGNTQSASTLETCLTSAVGGNADLVAFPSKPLYQLIDVRPYNQDIKVHPVAVTYPETTDQVSQIVKCATAEAGYAVQARGGGHSYGNYGLGGGQNSTIVVDLKNFQDFSMNENFEATIGGGTKLGDVTKRLLNSGNRAMAHGTCPDVGIGGHATMGGLGPTSRMWGTAMDHVIEYEVVLANSTIVKASATQYPEVFFALKGAGASFGIVTNFKVVTHPAPGQTVHYSYTFSARPFANLAQRFKDWQTMISDPNLSRKLASQVTLTELGMIISGTFFGSKPEFEALNITSIFPDSSTQNVTVFDDFLGTVANWAEDLGVSLGGLSTPFYSKNLAFTKEDLIPGDTIDTFFQYLDNVDKGTLIWFAIFDLEGGAINGKILASPFCLYTLASFVQETDILQDIPSNATAYGHRDALLYLQTYGVGIPTLSSTTRSFITGMDDIVLNGSQGKSLGSYPGYVDLQLPDAQQKYFGSNLPELERLKGILDPKDLFRNPQSIKPKI